MGKQDGAVAGTLCAVDLNAGPWNGSTARNIWVCKRLVHEETRISFTLTRAHERRGENICGMWLGGAVELICSESFSAAKNYILLHPKTYLLLSVPANKYFKI